jgi:hypothetical protein
VRVDPRYPLTLFAQILLPDQATIPRSTDGGRTWTDLTGVFALKNNQQQDYQDYSLSPVTIAPDGLHLYAGTIPYCQCDWGGQVLEYSRDAGQHWQVAPAPDGFAGTLALSANSSRLYGIFGATSHYGASNPTLIGTSADGGATWTAGSDPAALYAQHDTSGAIDKVTSLAVDPLRPTTVYAGIGQPYDSPPNLHPAVMRSDDAGRTWIQVTLPRTAQPIQSFRVGTDPREGTVLVGYTSYYDPPTDHIYLSRDRGQTWTTTTCPGEHNGACPFATFDNVFGAGASYAFFPDGIYGFHGAGPAETRIPQNDHLPFPLSDLLDVEGGTHAGDPIYLLGKGTYAGRISGLLWRSTDEGQRWLQVPLGFLWPTDQPPNHRQGYLFVPASNHSVAPPFVAAYRTLGPAILGLPLTEAHYTNAGIYRQDFANLRLELHGHRAVVAPLGTEEAAARHLHFSPAAPVATTATRRYFPATHHTLAGDFLRFWRAHGGQGVFGAPISEVLLRRDTQGRAYSVQWFTNARLEGRPSGRTTIVSIAPLGRESLLRRGWLP